MLLRKARSYAEIYNDLDGEVVNLFRVLRDQWAALRVALELTPFSRQEYRAAYFPAANDVERARRTLVKSFMGLGSNSTVHVSGFRSNSNRSGTTPAHDWYNLPGNIPALVDRLRGVVIENRPALEVMRQHDGPNTLHYVDPPYLGETRGDNKGYVHEMKDPETHRELAQELGSLRGAVAISGYPSPLYESLYAGWRRVERKALADGARPRVEVLWIRTARPGLGGGVG